MVWMPFVDSEESNRLRPQPLTEEDLTRNFRFSCDVPILLEPAGISQGLLTGLLRVGVNRTGGCGLFSSSATSTEVNYARHRRL